MRTAESNRRKGGKMERLEGLRKSENQEKRIPMHGKANEWMLCLRDYRWPQGSVVRE